MTTYDERLKEKLITLILLTIKTKIMEMEKFYVAPEVEVLEVEIERGFAASPWGTDGEDTDW